MTDIALSVRQPWASLIVAGLKTVEVRQWSTEHRGCLLIHAAKTVDEVGLERFPIENTIRGALIGTVRLVNVEQFTPGSWRALAAEHLQLGSLQRQLFAWYLEDPVTFARPIDCRGVLGLFSVSLVDLADSTERTCAQAKGNVAPNVVWGSARRT